MTLPDVLGQLDELATAATTAFAAAVDVAALEVARVEFLGAKAGRLKSAQKGLGKVEAADRPAVGKRFHEVKAQIETSYDEAVRRLNPMPPGQAIWENPVSNSGNNLGFTSGTPMPLFFDPTLPGRRVRLGKLHPITQTIEELKDIMGRLGFSTADGPEIEDEKHNFDALNIPSDHPARDPLENFYLSVPSANNIRSIDAPWCESPMLLRSQTSTVQIRVMECKAPPVRIISLGRVYRPDEADATHFPMFHQMEGLLIDKHVSMADLKSVLRLFASSYLGADVHIRFRPSFFPFTEPSVECDMRWQDRWIEFGGAGMVDPNVLRTVGYNPEEVSGFAFGLGIERLCMRRHGITDIREFYKNDVRFLRQF